MLNILKAFLSDTLREYIVRILRFISMLFYKVRDPEISWKETRRFLRKDPRWDALEVLPKPEKEKYFNEHIDELNKKRKKQFLKMLDENEVAFFDPFM